MKTLYQTTLKQFQVHLVPVVKLTVSWLQTTPYTLLCDTGSGTLTSTHLLFQLIVGGRTGRLRGRRKKRHAPSCLFPIPVSITPLRLLHLGSSSSFPWPQPMVCSCPRSQRQPGRTRSPHHTARAPAPAPAPAPAEHLKSELQFCRTCPLSS